MTCWAMITVVFTSSLAKGEESFWSRRAKQLHWKRNITGEAIEMTITAGDFVKADHKVEGPDGSPTRVDGYATLFADLRNGEMPPHITPWTVLWGGKKLKLDQGIYTSVFAPRLDGPIEDFEYAANNYWVTVRPSEDGEELFVTMGCGGDGVTLLLGYTISKDGKMRRFHLAGKA